MSNLIKTHHLLGTAGTIILARMFISAQHSQAWGQFTNRPQGETTKTGHLHGLDGSILKTAMDMAAGHIKGGLKEQQVFFTKKKAT